MNKRIAFFETLIGQENVALGSPVTQWLKGVLREVSEHRMVVTYTVREDMCNPIGLLHGGIASTMLDDVVGTLVYALGREFAFVTINLNVDFLNPAFPGDTLTTTAEVVRAGRTLIHVEARIVHTDGRIVAKCTTNMLQTHTPVPM